MCAGSKVQNVSNITVLTKLFTIANLHSVVKLTKKLTSLDSRPNKGIHVLTHSSVLITKEIIRLTLVIVPFSDIGSTESGTPKNIQKFMKIKKKNQFIQLWTVTKHDY